MYEFGAYIKNYMKAYPHIPEEDYPTFDDFDRNGDGTVTFKEWQAYLKEQKAARKSSAKASQKGYSLGGKDGGQMLKASRMYRKLKAAGGEGGLLEQDACPSRGRCCSPRHRRVTPHLQRPRPSPSLRIGPVARPVVTRRSFAAFSPKALAASAPRRQSTGRLRRKPLQAHVLLCSSRSSHLTLHFQSRCCLKKATFSSIDMASRSSREPWEGASITKRAPKTLLHRRIISSSSPPQPQ